MSKTAGVVEINGRRYNAVTGTVISTAIDGFVRRKRPQPAKKTSASSTEQTDKAKIERPARAVRQAKTVHKRTERSNTLLRNVVARPANRVKQVSSSFIKKSPRSVKTVDPVRFSKAKLVTRHAKVSRFGIPNEIKNTSETKDTPKKILSGEVLNSKYQASPDKSSTKTLSAPLSSMTSSASQNRLERMLDEALLRADAHKQSLKHKSRGWFGLPRWLCFILAALILLVIGAILAWRDIPVVAVKVAAVRSHVSASLPTYAPSGYSFNQAIGQPGKLTIQYREATQNTKTYTVSEQKSNLDSQSLSDNDISKNAEIQTSQVNGNTIYIYGPKSDAAWVNNGTLYTIKNNANLSSDELLRIVGGM